MELTLFRHASRWRVQNWAVIVIIFATWILPQTTVGAANKGRHNASHRSNFSGLDVNVMNGRLFGVDTAIHILRFSQSHFALKIGLARHLIDGGLQTPSDMCRATPGCVAAVNADYFNLTSGNVYDAGDSVGGLIRNCVLLHTPEISHQQVDLGDHSVSQAFDWSSTIDVNGVVVPINAINQELPLSYADVRVPLSGNVLFTSPYALRTPSGSGRMTYVFLTQPRTLRPTTINSTVGLTLVAKSQRALKVAPGHVDISVPSASEFSTLALGDKVEMTTSSTAGCNDIGGHPILLDQGVVLPVDASDSYMAEAYARTVLGWNSSGETEIMTVDGIDGVAGATARQLVALLRSQGIVTAIDLDGGNSTVFYALGRVLNHPSQGKERPVSTSLLVVRTR